MSATMASTAATGFGTPPAAEEAALSLRAYLEGLLRGGLPPPLPEPAPAPLIRRWPPRGRFDPSGIEFVDRHPEFWPGRSSVPTRKVQRLSNTAKKGWRGIFQSRKMRRPMRHHTGVELGALWACEADAAVSAFVEHPARVRICLGPACRMLLPAVYAERSGERWLLVCRREEAAARPENEPVWASFGQVLSGAGVGFEIVTERHCAQRPLAGSITTLLRGRWADLPDARARDLAIQAASAGRSVAEACLASGLSAAQVWALMLGGEVGADPRSTLNEGTKLSSGPFIDPVPLWSAP